MDYDLDPILTIEEKYEEIQNRYIRSFFKIRFPLEELVSNEELIKEEIVEIIECPLERPLVSNDENNEKKVCEVCNGTYSYFNRKRHLTTKKHINAMLIQAPDG